MSEFKKKFLPGNDNLAGIQAKTACLTELYLATLSGEATLRLYLKFL